VPHELWHDCPAHDRHDEEGGGFFCTITQPGNAQRVTQTVLMDVTTITNVGILGGALWIAARNRTETRPLTGTQWAIGLLAGVLGLLPALPVGGPLLGALVGPWLGAALGELLAQTRNRQDPLPVWQQLRRGGLVGLAVVLGMLVSRLAQGLLALVGVVGFVLLSR
jgi:uncharacterized protein YqgC (DUF456 family)